MSKKHFIALADALRSVRPVSEGQHELQRERFAGRLDAWKDAVSAVADACASINPAFNRQRWLDYVNGRCGPSGGAVKGKRQSA